MTRLLTGFNYFWNLKPTQCNAVTLVYLHEWQKLLKASIGKKPDEPLSEKDMDEIATKIFAS
jgi:hypothetical protein